MTQDKSQDDKVALIDLDGTVCDYDRSMRAMMRSIQAQEETLYCDRYTDGSEPPHIEARRKLIQKMPGFWRNLQQHSIGFQIVDECRAIGFDLHVLTKGPADSTGAWSEKISWCQEHLKDAQVTVTQNKSLTYGRVLCDDYPYYFNAWLKRRPRGLVVCVAQPWNAGISNPNVLRFDGTNRVDLRERLQQAFDR